jgi:hypothetical protein
MINLQLEGYQVKLNENITFRPSNENDKDLEENIIPNGYTTFVKIHDCKITEIDGKRFYDSTNASAIPIIYIDSWYGIGEFKKRTSEKGIEIDGIFVYEYEQAPIYFSYNGKVYVGSIKNLLN